MPHILKADDPVRLAIAGKIRLARSLRGLSQTALAEPLGLSFQQVQKFETGVNRVTADQLVHLARTLAVPCAWFFEGLDHGTPIAPGPANRSEQAALEAFRRLPASTRAGMLRTLQDLAGQFEPARPMMTQADEALWLGSQTDLEDAVRA